MKWFTIKITALFCIGLGFTEIHMVIYYLYPKTAEIEYSLWLDKSFHQPITVLWYIYELTSILKNLIWVYATAKICYLFSYKLFNVMIVFFFYYVTQFAFYVWNRNTVFFSNLIVYIYMALAILLLFLPSKKGGKIVNIEDYY